MPSFNINDLYNKYKTVRNSLAGLAKSTYNLAAGNSAFSQAVRNVPQSIVQFPSAIGKVATNPAVKQVPQNVIGAATQLPSAIGTAGKVAFQMGPRAVASEQLGLQGRESITPTTLPERFLLGSEPVVNPQLRGRELGEQAVKMFGAEGYYEATPKQEKRIGHALNFLDISPTLELGELAIRSRVAARQVNKLKLPPETADKIKRGVNATRKEYEWSIEQVKSEGADPFARTGGKMTAEMKFRRVRDVGGQLQREGLLKKGLTDAENVKILDDFANKIAPKIKYNVTTKNTKQFFDDISKETFKIFSNNKKLLGTAAHEATPLGASLGRETLKREAGALKDFPQGFIGKKPPPLYRGETTLTTTILDNLKGHSSVSKQFISDLTNQPSLRQPERDLIRNLLKNEGDTINVKEFANKVKTELLPLKRFNVSRHYRQSPSYENISLPSEVRGPIADYNEHIYQSPIKTSAGDVHFSQMGNAGNNYFAHSRIEDLPAKTNTRRVIEIQSDLFQKGRLESETDITSLHPRTNYHLLTDKGQMERQAELSKLEPYRNTWYERIIREEVKQAAKDSKTKLQFPTGETAMKIEGLGNRTNWLRVQRVSGDNVFSELSTDQLRVGNIIRQNSRMGGDWIITDVLGDGKFKAVPKEQFERLMESNSTSLTNKTPFAELSFEEQLKEANKYYGELKDISGKVDTSNPIYQFYEKQVGKFLNNQFGAKRIKDPQGVEWWEIDITPQLKTAPVKAFGYAPTKLANYS